MFIFLLNQPHKMRTLITNIIIKTTSLKLWEALTSAELSRQYWSEREIRSDWKVGSGICLVEKGGVVNWQGKILSIDPYALLSYTFDVSTDPRFHGIHPEHSRFLGDEPISKVTYELKPFGDAMLLTIRHEDLSEALEQVANMSWTYVASSLKSLLETGAPLTKLNI
jgi:uncharacterized protein YndB with AHSA1/START domain